MVRLKPITLQEFILKEENSFSKDSHELTGLITDI
jgi:hypothetical protein